TVSLAERFKSVLYAYGFYIQKTIWPLNLEMPYPEPVHGISFFNTLWPGLLLGGVSSYVWIQRKKEPALLAGWLWYVAALLPVSGMIKFGEHIFAADRYSYVPLIGLFWMGIAWTALRVQKRETRILIAGGILIFWSFLTYAQTLVWHNSRSF